MKPHAFHPEADAEYAAAAEQYAGLGPDLGGRFYDEIERLIAIIKEGPHRFREYDPPARRLLATGFPYAVVYIEQPDRVWIVAVMHGKRRSGYWKARLR